MEQHAEALRQVCRIEGCKFSALSRSTQYPACEFVSELKACFDVEVDKDIERVHPPNICFLCRKVVSRYSDAVGAGRSYTVTGGGCSPVQKWHHHSNMECIFCYQLEQKNVGGRPKRKRKKVDRCCHVSCVAAQSGCLYRCQAICCHIVLN